MATTYVLAFYEIDRAYGGPEEGGWWFDCGQLVRIVRTFKSEEKAYRAARRANGWLDRLQKHVRDVGSVAYDGGRYAAEVHEDFAPAHYPDQRPHYE